MSGKEGDPGEPDAAYVIKPEKLDRFISYQERSLALYSQLLDELSRPGAQDGGGASSLARVRRLAEAQERLRRELGLSPTDVREMERIVGDVVARRASAGASPDDSVQQLEALAERMPTEQRAEFQATIASLKRQQEATLSLSEERRKYGDANVDLVLTREAELIRQWNQAIAAFAGEKARAPRDAGTAGDARTRGAREAGADGGADASPDSGVRLASSSAASPDAGHLP